MAVEAVPRTMDRPNPGAYLATSLNRRPPLLLRVVASEVVEAGWIGVLSGSLGQS